MKENTLTQEDIECIKFNQKNAQLYLEISQSIKTLEFIIFICTLFVFIFGNTIVQDIIAYVAFIFITVTFWIFDSRYIQEYRKYEKHHCYIVSSGISSNAVDLWVMNPNKYTVPNLVSIMFSFEQKIYFNYIIIVTVVLFLDLNRNIIKLFFS